MDADIAGINHCLVSVEEVMAKHGKTARDVFESNAATANVALSVGAEQQLPAEVFAPTLYPQITAQKAAYLTPTPLPPPPAASIEAIGDKGVAKLLELLEKVGDGTIDRESGIETAIRVFSLTRSQAEKLMPEEPDEAALNRAAGLDVKGRHAPVAAPAAGKQVNGSRNGKSKAKAR